ncbi:tripartite tricarboxylate transporter TctB family protein [Billgrantia endophytica]|uniref:TctB protein n=1 Tax=Billgrantia endophytica TaxID=2033802 RepID=A0A2N7TWT7_9GAMM|nr:tripartite tricarboxylate transporter TctB family protein [Halomonas endophytica]PMR72636.1 TctB protein [Halomonas endophytica]
MTRLNSNQILGLIIALLAVGYLAMAFQIPDFPLPRPIDSDLFPKVLGFTLFGLAVMLFLEKPKDRDIPDEIGPEERAKPLLLRPWSRVVITSLAIVAYALLLVPVGFVLTSLALSFGLAWYFGYRRHGVNLATSLGVVLLLYLAMTRGMDVYLPQGILPF